MDPQGRRARRRQLPGPHDRADRDPLRARDRRPAPHQTRRADGQRGHQPRRVRRHRTPRQPDPRQPRTPEDPDVRAGRRVPHRPRAGPARHDPRRPHPARRRDAVAGRRRLPGRVRRVLARARRPRPAHRPAAGTTRNRYRITKAFLDHVALVSEGAYGEKAGVLAVRAADDAAAPAGRARRRRSSTRSSSTKWRQKLADIDAKYLKIEVPPPGRVSVPVSTELPAVEDHRVGRQ